MTNTNPLDELREAVTAADARIDAGRALMATAGDDRARAIERAVAAFPRGEGRPAVATALGTSIGQVDVALRRARTAERPTGFPHDLLGRLYALEAADLPPQPAEVWQAAAQVLHGTLVNVTWLEAPGQLLALEAEDAAGEEIDEQDAKALAHAARSWSRVQALAVIDAIQRGAVDTLPGTEECER